MEKLTVLVVDDDREIVESIAIFLQADGYLVRKAYNGLEALDIVMTENVHLIILDIMMPELDGIKTLLKVRESKNLPIILLSSHITSDLDKIADEITFIHKGEVLLSEPRDELLDTCGILRCTADQLDALDPSAVRAKRVGAFGCEALVRRDGIPENWSVEPVNIEQIMLFLTRGEDAR